jgi:hypothetical protein
MSFAELMPTLLELNRADKLRVMQLLANELAKEEGVFFQDGAEYPVWSPYHSFEAADVLSKLLEEAKQNA